MDSQRYYLVMLLCLGATFMGTFILSYTTMSTRVFAYKPNTQSMSMYTLIKISIILSIVLSIITGYLLDKISPVKIMAIIILGICLIAYLFTLTHEPYKCYELRLAFILLPPLIWSSCTKITSIYIPRNRIGLATALYVSGSSIGSIISYIILYRTSYDWRTVLQVSALIGVLYVAALYYVMTYVMAPVSKKNRIESTSDSYEEKTIHGEKPPLENIFILLIGFFLALQAEEFLIIRKTMFLGELRFTNIDLMLYCIILFGVSAVIAKLCSGIVSDMIGGLKGRKTVLLTGQLVTALGLILLFYTTKYGEGLLRLLFFIASYSFASAAYWALIIDVSPPEYVGRIAGLYTAVNRISFHTGLATIGYLASITGDPKIGYIYSAATLAASTMFYLLLKQYHGETR